MLHDMRLTVAAHIQHPWLVRSIASDFVLDEVWEFPFEASAAAGDSFETFCAMQDAAQTRKPGRGLADLLMRFRLWLGRAGSEDERKPLPIPGCSESSLRERLEPDELSKPLPALPPSPLPFKLVYQRENERLFEFSSRPVHGLAHYGWVPQGEDKYRAQMAVYFKPRGLVGRAYMALIWPFRVWVVYPAIMRVATAHWNRLHT
jgi:hypothetical protein